MISAPKSMDFQQKSGRKYTISCPKKGDTWKQVYSVRIQPLALLRCTQFRSEVNKSSHQVESSHFCLQIPINCRCFSAKSVHISIDENIQW